MHDAIISHCLLACFCCYWTHTHTQIECVAVATRTKRETKGTTKKREQRNDKRSHVLLLFINTDLFCRTRFSFSSFKIFFAYFHRAIQPTYPVESYARFSLLLSCENHDILHAKCHTFWANRDSTNYSFHTTKNLAMMHTIQQNEMRL